MRASRLAVVLFSAACTLLALIRVELFATRISFFCVEDATLLEQLHALAHRLRR